MADDPHRDILPINEGSCIGTCRSALVAGLISDPRERHAVCKLDRYQLEDRYLCLLDERQALKKLLNAQEDKSKRLTTKIMRITASARPCLAAMALDDGKIRIAELERENTKLKERMFVIKSQIFSYRGVRLSSQRRCAHCTSSRPLTSRSEGTKTKTSTSTLYEEKKTEFEAKQRAKIEELVKQRQDMMMKISELEEVVSNYKAQLEKEKQREVIVDNKQSEEAVEVLKQNKEQLSAVEQLNGSLKNEIEELRQLLAEKSTDNGRMSAAFFTEKSRLSEVDGIVAKAHDWEMTLREKDEQIRALTNEIKILQQHNSELVSLSTKHSEVEEENASLREQLAKQQEDHHNLKRTFNHEQANITALQAVNSQLMDKLQELQTNMDALTIQLNTIQGQNERSGKSEKIKASEKPERLEKSEKSEKLEAEKLETQAISNKRSEKAEHFGKSNNSCEVSKQSETRETIKTINKMTSMTPRSDGDTKGNGNASPRPQTYLEALKPLERKESSTQTDKIANIPQEICSTDRLNVAEVGKSLRDHGKPVEMISTALLKSQEPMETITPKSNGQPIEMITGGGLSGDEMLKLLDQAEINDAPKIGHYDGYNAMNRQRGGCCCFEPNCSQCDAQNLIRLLCNTLNEYSNIVGVEVFEKSEAGDQSENVDKNNNTEKAENNPSEASEGNKTEETLEELGKKTIFSPCFCCEDPCRFLYTANHSCPPALTFKTIIDDIQSSLQKTLNNLQDSEKKINSKHYEVLPKPRNKINCRKLLGHCSTNSAIQEIRRKPCCPIRVMSHQGLLEIHISSLHLSSFSVNHLFGEFPVAPSIFISLDFCGQGSIFPPTQATPTLTFNSSCIYRILKLPKFLECLIGDPMYFQIYTANPGSQPYIIANGKISVNDLLDYPQNKLHYIVDMESALPCYRNENFGQIFFWIKLSCDIEEVKTFRQRKDVLHSSNSKPLDQIPESRESSMTQIRRRGLSLPSQYDLEDFDKSARTQDEPLASSRKRQKKSDNWSAIGADLSAETLQTIHDYRKRDTRFASSPSSHPSPFSSSSETDLVTNYEESRADTLQKKADSWRAWSTGDHPIKRDEIREAIKQNKMSNSLDMNEQFFDDASEVKAEDWHRFKRRSLNSQIIDSSDAVVFRIERLSLLPRCPLIKNPSIIQLYVEFSFLGNYGLDLETVSTPIPKKPPYHLFFNYMKKFSIDEKYHLDQRKKLQEMMSDEVSSSIKFTIVNEPLMEEMETKECVEVGHAYLNLREHVMKDGAHDISLTVMNAEGTDTLGKLKITLLGVDAIRNCIPKD